MAKIMKDIHSIQISVGENVVNQGKMINSIDNHASQAYTNTQKGLENLKQAEKRQKSGTKCL